MAYYKLKRCPLDNKIEHKVLLSEEANVASIFLINHKAVSSAIRATRIILF